MDHILELIIDAITEKKAIKPIILDLAGISNVTDYFFICSGKTPIQVRAIADNIIDKVNEQGSMPPKKEGYQEGRWVLLDFGHIVAHIMHESEREFYALENLWHDAKKTELSL